MKKSIGIISQREGMGEFYKSILEEMFGDKADIYSCSLEKETLRNFRCCDIYLNAVTSYDLMRNPWAYEFMPEEESLVQSNVMFSKAAVDLLETYKKGTRAMLVNQTLHMALESISQLYHLGIDNIEFEPYYPEINETPELELVFGTGEEDIFPKGNYHIVDLGNRLLTPNTLTEIALKLNDPFFIESDKFRKYRNRLAKVDYSLQKISSDNLTTENKMEIILNSLDEGIICLDEKNRVSFVNKTARRMFDVSRNEVLDRSVTESFPDLQKGLLSENREYLARPVLMEIGGNEIGVSIRPLHIHDRNVGSFITLQSFSKLEKQQNELVLQTLKKTHKAKHRFEDIIGQSDAIQKTINIARKIAVSDANVLIEGESGTGKKIFAEAIHNASPRAAEPFIAVNCASISDDILGIELFGYAEGAFQGAKPGGKAGLIECANRGTLFLDGIDGMSRTLQARLISVLEDGQILRTGSDEPVPVDIRVISSTNEDLRSMVSDGSFRRDLYYRLKVVPLHIPTLRERKEDIPALREYFMMKLDAFFKMEDEAKLIFNRHKWEGNVRELRNCIEYLKYLDKKTIEKSDLPEQIFEIKNERKTAEPPENTGKFTLTEYRTMQVLSELYKREKSAGRHQITKACTDMGYAVSEYEIRTALEALQKEGMVDIGIGRSGTRLTEQGYLAFRQISSQNQPVLSN